MLHLAIIDSIGLSYDGDSLENQGLGGSESAVILISKALYKQGFEVDVYCNCFDHTPGVYDGVNFISNDSEFPQKKYDVVISSRQVHPFYKDTKWQFALNANYRVVWMHDTFLQQDDEYLEDMLLSGEISEVFTLSDFHTNYVTNNEHASKKRNFEVLKKKFWQTRNGAKKWIDEVDTTKKDKNHFVFNASVTKGLEPLLKRIWPRIKERISDARLTVIGGFYRFREGWEPDEQEKLLREYESQELYKKLDVNFTGVITQKEIAEIYSNAYMFLYPTAFPETFGISSLESLLYKTPLITHTFGALEETAIDQACYKIPYSCTPNSLFPHINEDEQVERFLQTFFDAYDNEYLHQQKQNACSLVDNVYSWDTVALQWKQHLFNVFSVPFPVNDYREVTKINYEVARVFNRQKRNYEDIHVYPRLNSTEKRIVVISPFWNAERFIAQNILSVAQQDYDNYLHLLIDDCSEDSSYEVAVKTLQMLPDNVKEKFLLKRNEENKGAICNQLETIASLNDDDIIVLLDGDDWLISNNTIFNYYNNLYHEGYDFTYGSMMSVADGIPLIAQSYPKHIIDNKAYREHKFNWGIPYTHLRTFSKHLSNDLDTDKFKKDGQWMKAGADNPLFYELIERAKAPYAVKNIVCYYNDAHEYNDFRMRGEEQNENAGITPKKETSSETKKILIAIPTNRYIEPETMKSIYDLDVPEGYTTQLEFFYGYQIDQIRNLIAEWAKNFDYLFSVDSDIVLPKDSLRKFIDADKDVISGLYIQRKPHEHTLEIYESVNGGQHNIPYDKIKDKGVFEIAACGFGCVLIKSEVFREMPYPHFEYTSALTMDDTISEDVYFCSKAKHYGFKIWADATVVCDHKGNTFFKV